MMARGWMVWPAVIVLSIGLVAVGLYITDPGWGAREHQAIGSGNEEVALGETWTYELPSVPQDERFWLHLNLSMVAGGLVDVEVLDGEGALLKSEGDAEDGGLVFKFLPGTGPRYVTITPVNEKGTSFVWTASISTDRPRDVPLWNNDTVLLLGLVGIGLAAALLIAALRPAAALDDKARPFMSHLRFHRWWGR